MVSQLHLAQFSHLTFQECHSELCGVIGIPRNGIFFHLIHFRLRHFVKARGGNRPFYSCLLSDLAFEWQ